MAGLVLLAAGPLTGAASPSPSPPAAEPRPYSLTLGLDGPPPTAGDEGRARLTLVPRGAWVLKAATPLHIELAAQGPLRLPRRSYSAADWSAPPQGAAGRDVVMGIVGEAPGEAQLSASVSFFLCSEAVCRRFTDHRQLTVTVAASRGARED